jgi:hypothetical protein
VSTGSVWPGRAAPVAAVRVGVVTLGLAAVSVVLDSLTHQPGTGGPAVDAFITAVGLVPVAAVGTLLAARCHRGCGRCCGRCSAGRSRLEALDLDGEPAFATPPYLPPPTLAWGSWKP